jgi:hypothetical protein
MAEKPVSVKVHLPHPALPPANWADCYALRVHAPGLTAMDAARMAVGQFPVWVRSLMKFRNAVAGLFGLKSSTHHSPDETEMIGIFPVVSRTEKEVVLGFDDRHLDFRIVIDVSSHGDGGQTVRATTLVDRKILLGKIYIAVITPFHKLIVKEMLQGLGNRLSALT